MTQEEKNLLLKDLSSILPYGVIIEHEGNLSKLDTIFMCDSISISSTSMDKKLSYNLDLDEVKPYLFPLSSMTEEQYKEWCDLEANPLDEILTRNANGEKMSILEHHLLIAKSLTDSVNYCYKNHFDVYGLIPMGLAIDATKLNIY